ncbi:MAG: glycosyltransferase [Acidobacteria bacterium]|nr:glycosyltransferase [Acidobacteriota bacterium]
MSRSGLRILALSEHYRPRVGGTVNYVVESCAALAGMGHSVRLLVPGSPGLGSELVEGMSVERLETTFPSSGDPSRDTRYQFCREAESAILENIRHGEADVVHVMFGLFLMEVLNTEAIRKAGAPIAATVHNVPPMECGRSWQGEPLHRRLKDALRLRAVARMNAYRLRRHRYDAYVTPSDPVTRALSAILPGADVTTIGHGIGAELAGLMNPPDERRPQPGAPLRLLTVGGWAPHKRQHLLPAVAERLMAGGLKIHWDVVGPSGRLAGYFDAVRSEIAQRDLGESVLARGAAEQGDLARLYDGANIYVQPSTEEGFCLTALDAAACGLPVIASPAGALPRLSADSGGECVESDPQALAEAILRFVREDRWAGDPRKTAEAIRQRYSWSAAATDLTSTYQRLLRAGTAAHSYAPSLASSGD